MKSNFFNEKHPFWDVVRYIVSIRGEKERGAVLDSIIIHGGLVLTDNSVIPISGDIVGAIKKYFDDRSNSLAYFLSLLRDENESTDYCKKNGFDYGVNKTQNEGHHQSSKSLIAAVSGIAAKVALDFGIDVDVNPQRRCVWLSEKGLHVTARNLDGAIPSVFNPLIVWEIKEYWGVTSGGSKMSDAVYECQLVGKELLDFTAASGVKIKHLVFLDGKNQWGKRKSDLARFIDLENQGLIDKIFVGKSVELNWENYLRNILSTRAV